MLVLTRFVSVQARYVPVYVMWFAKRYYITIIIIICFNLSAKHFQRNFWNKISLIGLVCTLALSDVSSLCIIKDNINLIVFLKSVHPPYIHPNTSAVIIKELTTITKAVWRKNVASKVCLSCNHGFLNFKFRSTKTMVNVLWPRMTRQYQSSNSTWTWNAEISKMSICPICLSFLSSLT